MPALNSSLRAVVGLIVLLTATQALAQNQTIQGAKSLPVEVRAAIRAAMKRCPRKATTDEGFLTRRDINGDGVDDFVLDYGHMHCSGSTVFLCGSGGCLTEVFASRANGTFVAIPEYAEAIAFEKVEGVPAMLLELHGTFCGKGGAESCRSILYWNGQTFAPGKN